MRYADSNVIRTGKADASYPHRGTPRASGIAVPTEAHGVIS